MSFLACICPPLGGSENWLALLPTNQSRGELYH
jgi:hypothetical protein